MSATSELKEDRISSKINHTPEQIIKKIGQENLEDACITFRIIDRGAHFDFQINNA